MTTLPPPSDARRPLEVLARIVTTKQAIEDGAITYAWAVLHDLELDLAGDPGPQQERPAA
jgi:hypothetical protein